MANEKIHVLIIYGTDQVIGHPQSTQSELTTEIGRFDRA